MTKKKALFVSAVLIGVSLLIEILRIDGNTLLDGELINFLYGAFLGSGIGIFLGNILRNVNNQVRTEPINISQNKKR
ncbi:hypothetical protein EV201_0866 [Ancylomarina subtilis]|uniref:Uncharacterized protein n=1 Tax=Ancylomarina subtilis TaxID=1639035 RepID=A0A4Q7VJ70_9BACT|nr:hypothetical protein [Ancylomarina subtilis]RZT96230.1 hypothetical protein EV201_0866 [Ancylomarina subtilis]